MYSRTSKDAMIPTGGRNHPVAAPPQHRRGFSHNIVFPKRDAYDDEDNMDLFSNNRRTFSSDDDDDEPSQVVSSEFRRHSLGSAKPERKSGSSRLDDLLSSSTDSGKHDYDWLLTPPGTPSSDVNEYQPAAVAPSRSVSTTRASRLSVSQSGRNNPGRPKRSSSVTRPSVSTSQYSSYSNKSASILNTSSGSVSSYMRPSTPTGRSSSTARRSSNPSSILNTSSGSVSSYRRPSTPTSRSSSTARPSNPSSVLNTSSGSVSSYIRPSTPTSRSSSTARPSNPSPRPNLSRPSTPSRSSQHPSPSSFEKTRPSQTSRPSTPTSTPQRPVNSSSPGVRSTSRPSMPSRKSLAPSLSPASGRTVSSISRPSSPAPRIHQVPQPIVFPDFLSETPPNLRTTLPDRSISAGRPRPGAAVTVKRNTETTSAANPPRRQPSPLASRGRLTEPSGPSRITKGQQNEVSDSHRATNVSELFARKPLKVSSDSTGLGRTISKNSLNMAIRHMDIRNNPSGVRSLSGSARYPQSIRSTSTKSQPSPAINPAPRHVNASLSISRNGGISENCSDVKGSPNETIDEDKPQIAENLTDVDIHDGSRYDAILLKEDWKNTDWLHTLDYKTDQESIFDDGLEPLPEPFSPL